MESSNFKLGDEQINAINSLKDFLNNDEVAFLVSGYAGTGKTTIMKIFIEYLQSINKPYCLCAPTHKAKLVLEGATGGDAITLHKLLSLTPNIEILELDFNSLQFVTRGKKNGIPTRGVVICDESSMINDGLFTLLCQRCADIKTKIVFLGDIAQLKPINENTSKVFSVSCKVNLTKIYRQAEDNIVLNVLKVLRDQCIDHFQDITSVEGSIECIDLKEFVKNAVLKYREAITIGDITCAKVLAYTNKRVTNYNEIIHKFLFSDNAPYYKGEFLTGYENIDTGVCTFFNSMDYVITEEPIKVDITIPEFGVLPSWQLDLYDSVTNEVNRTNILSGDIDISTFAALAALIEYYRISAIQSKNRTVARQYWKVYYEILNSFTSPINLYYDNRLVRKKSFDYGYACTVHRSQGSSYNDVLVDIQNIKKCFDSKERRQLEYVALSRTRHDVFILQ